MAKRNSSNQDFTNNADGFTLSGGTTPRALTLTGADVSFSGSGSAVLTFPSTTDTLVGRATTDTLTNKTLTSAIVDTSLLINSGGIINWASGDVTLTHATNTLTFAGATTGYTFDSKISTTIADSANVVGLTVTQNDTTNNPRGVVITNAGTGNTLFLDPNGNAGTGNSTGGALLIENSGNTSYALNVNTNNNAPTRLVRISKQPSFTTTVNGAQTIDTSSTTLTVASTSGFPSSGTLIILNSSSFTENGKSIYLHYTSTTGTTFVGTAGVFYKEATSINLINGAQVWYVNTSNTYIHTLIEDADSNGGSVNMKLRGPNPDLEFHALGGYYNDGGEGQFELDIPLGDNTDRISTDVFRINGRNDANSSFNSIAIFKRPGAIGQGMVGIGFQNATAPVTMAAHLHVKNDTNFGDTNAAALIASIFQGASSQTAALTEWRNHSGTVLASVSAAGLGTFTGANPISNDGGALGTTSLQWSDLFLASGGVINWANGDVTITHASDSLTLAGAASGYIFTTTGGSNNREQIIKATVSDASNDAFFVYNGTTTNSAFMPSFAGFHNTSTARASLNFVSLITAANDTGTTPIMIFDNHLTSSTSDPVNNFSGAITTRPLFDFQANSVSVLKINANSTMVFSGASFSPATNDISALGTSSLMWSDLFLASGGVINFNAGNATLTHSAGLLTSNVDIVVPDEAYGAGWNGSVEVPTKNAVYDKIETLGGGGGMQEIVFTPLNNEPPATNFATFDTRNSVPVLDFDSSTDESAVFGGVLPTTYAGGGLTVRIVWMCTSATSGTCTWNAAFEAHPDDAFDIDSDGFAAANAADGTAASVSGEQQYTDITFSDGADMDSLAAGESFRLKITRDQDSGTDDIASDVELLRVVVFEI